jgi:long-subunit fatty acid transport protein
VSVGATYRLGDNWFFDLAYNHVFLRDTQIDVTRKIFEGTGVVSTAHVSGQVQSQGNTVALSFRYAM